MLSAKDLINGHGTRNKTREMMDAVSEGRGFWTPDYRNRAAREVSAKDLVWGHETRNKTRKIADGRCQRRTWLLDIGLWEQD